MRLLVFSAVLSTVVAADDVPHNLTPEERRGLEVALSDHRAKRLKFLQARDFNSAAKESQVALDVAHRLHPKAEFPNGHAAIADSLHDYAMVYNAWDKNSQALPLLKEALDMDMRLHQRDHIKIVHRLENLAAVYPPERAADVLALSEQALAMYRRLPQADDLVLCGKLRNVAWHYRRQGKPAEAERCLCEALEVKTRLAARQPGRVGVSRCDELKELGDLFKSQSRLRESEALYREVLAERRREVGGDHMDVATDSEALASVLVEQHKLPEAAALFAGALETRRRLLRAGGPNHNALAAVYAQRLDQVGDLYVQLGRPVAAAICYSEALHLDEGQFLAGLQPDLTRLRNRAFSYASNPRRQPEAEARLKRILDLYEARFRGKDLNIAYAAEDLAALCGARGRLPEAEALWRRAIEVRRATPNGDLTGLLHAFSRLASVCELQGKLEEAEVPCREARAIVRLLPSTASSAYWSTAHTNLMFRMAALRHGQGRFLACEAAYSDIIEEERRVRPRDTHNLSAALYALGTLQYSQGKYAAAERAFLELVAIRRRTSPSDVHGLVSALFGLGQVYRYTGRFPMAEEVYDEALTVARREYRTDHFNTATAASRLGNIYNDQGKYAEAEPLLKEALDMRKRLAPGDSVPLAHALHNLGRLHRNAGRYEAAEPLLREALAVWQRVHRLEQAQQGRRLFNTSAGEVVACMNSLGHLHLARGNAPAAAETFSDALELGARLLTEYANAGLEGDALTFASTRPACLGRFLSACRAADASPESVYHRVWRNKGTVGRVYEQRQLAARVGDPAARAVLQQLAEARSRRAQLLLMPAASDPDQRKMRDAALAALDARVAELDGKAKPWLPTARTERLDAASPADLQTCLPGDCVVVDFLRYTHTKYDPKRPGKAGESESEEYAAFVVSRDRIRWIELGPATKLEPAVAKWREAIQTPPYGVPPDLAAQVRGLLWDGIGRHLPQGTKVVYVCPDAELTRVPWGAIPGREPGSVLLDDVAFAVVPHVPFLLEALWQAGPPHSPELGLLSVGGVAFGKRPVPRTGVASARGDLPIDASRPPVWADLPGAKAEAEQVADRAARRRIPVRTLTGADASAEQLLVELPRAGLAHIATHGFFADSGFRSALQIDPKEAERAAWGERVGPLARTPLAMSGLVLAGANVDGTPGRGILTGEALIDLDLTGLSLAVLSACETGLGDVAGGEGVYGLQRAFHVAGARNVVASLWKVPDAATAALMGEFYRALWEDQLPPVRALQKAQLAVYRATPDGFTDLARRGPGLGDADLDKTARVVARAPLAKDGRNPPVVWAAFSLSGVGR